MFSNYSVMTKQNLSLKNYDFTLIIINFCTQVLNSVVITKLCFLWVILHIYVCIQWFISVNIYSWSFTLKGFFMLLFFFFQQSRQKLKIYTLMLRRITSLKSNVMRENIGVDHRRSSKHDLVLERINHPAQRVHLHSKIWVTPQPTK